MLPSTSPREALLVCPPSPPRNLPFLTVESTLSSSCSHSGLPLTHQGVALTLIFLSLARVRLSLTLTLSPFMIWYSGWTVLFLFLLAKAALEYLPIALSVALRSLFPFQQAQYVQVFLLNPFCMLFAGLSSTIKSNISRLLLSDSRFVLTCLSSPPSFLLPQSLWQELSFLSFSSVRLQWVPGYSFFLGNDTTGGLAT